MTYEHIVTGTFVSRPNRFIAHVKTGNRTVVCHVKNTGRCRELLIPGVTVILEFHPDAVLSGRKTEYDLIGVYKNGLLINMDSQAPTRPHGSGWSHWAAANIRKKTITLLVLMYPLTYGGKSPTATHGLTWHSP